MLLSDHVLFVHAPKTAGMTVTAFLAESLPGPKVLTLPPGHVATAPGVTVERGTRHETLDVAAAWLAARGRSLSDVTLVLGVIRNPYDLEVSRFHYLRRGSRWDAGAAQDVAMAGDFERFAREVPYPKGAPGIAIERWYTIDGVTPPNMRLVRFERLAVELADAVAPWGTPVPLAHLNQTGRGHWKEYLTPAAEEAIHDRHRWLFRFYPRVQVRRWWRLTGPSGAIGLRRRSA